MEILTNCLHGIAVDVLASYFTSLYCTVLCSICSSLRSSASFGRRPWRRSQLCIPRTIAPCQQGHSASGKRDYESIEQVLPVTVVAPWRTIPRDCHLLLRVSYALEGEGDRADAKAKHYARKHLRRKRNCSTAARLAHMLGAHHHHHHSSKQCRDNGRRNTQDG